MCVAAQGDVAEAIDESLEVPIGNEVVIEEQDDDGAIIDDNGHDDDLQDQNDIGDDEPQDQGDFDEHMLYFNKIMVLLNFVSICR